MSKKYKTRNLLPYHIIASAVGGDMESAGIVLNCYSHYINALSKRRFYDEFGNPKFSIDMELRSNLEYKLLTTIPKFDLHRAESNS